MSVSINNSITIRDYEIYDDLELVDEKVVTNIVNGLFTSTVPDWDVNDPNSPYYIRNKPTKTSDFINDGADGTSRYVELSEITDLGRVDDVQVKLQSQYNSVVSDKIAKIDLSNFVTKEYRTGSQYLYKVLSDNNFSDAYKDKVNVINIGGDGTLALTNNGSYKALYNILSVNGITPDINKDIKLTASDIRFDLNDTVYSRLNRSVLFKSSSDKQIVLENSKALLGNSTTATEYNLAKVDSLNNVVIGSNNAPLVLNSSVRPKINSEDIAYLSDITSAVSTHNSDITAHSDIRAAINNLKTGSLIRATNSEMTNYINLGTLTNGQLVLCEDDGTYTKGIIYRYSNSAFEVFRNYQNYNIYGYGAPTSSTVGTVGQLYFDLSNKKIYRCTYIDGSSYSWEEFAVSQVSRQDLANIINNTTYISDAYGGFTAGNGYRLLDSSGMIPIERIPQSVLRGMVYGGLFDDYGIIMASSTYPELNGVQIDTISMASYENVYFLCGANYTFGGISYVAGNFALCTGTEWIKVDNPGQIVSVNGQQGVVVLDAGDVGALSLTDANHSLVDGASLSYNGNTVLLNLSAFNLSTQQSSSGSVQIDLADASTAGLMSYDKFNEVETNTSNISVLQRDTMRLLYTASTSPTVSDINTFVTSYGYSSPFTGICVIIDQTFNVWHYYTDGSGWVDDGKSGVSIFTNASAGMVLGSNLDGYISANIDGTGSVNGWSTLVSDVSQMSSDIADKLDTQSSGSGNSITLDNFGGDYSFTKSSSSGYDSTLSTALTNVSAMSDLGFGLYKTANSGDFVRFFALGTDTSQSQVGIGEIDITNDTSSVIQLGSYTGGIQLYTQDGSDSISLEITSTSATINGDSITTNSQLPTAYKTAELNN